MDKVLGVLTIIGHFLLKVLIGIGKVLIVIGKVIIFLMMHHRNAQRMKEHRDGYRR